jgi:tetratricopeptide (TPR) repeat protein
MFGLLSPEPSVASATKCTQVRGGRRLYEIILGRDAEAETEIKRALELDSLSLIINTKVGWVYYYSRRYPSAIDQLRNTLEMDKNFPLAHLFLGLSYEQSGQLPQAVSEFTAGLHLGYSPWLAACLGHTYALAGKRADAYGKVEELKTASKEHFVSPYFIATIYAGLRDRDKAFDWLNRAHTERSDWLTYLKVDPAFDPLRSDPRYADLLRRIGLPQ